MTMSNTNQQGQGSGSLISNAAFNALAALHSKLEGLEGYRTYSQDGDQHLWPQPSGPDTQAVEMIIGKLERFVRDNQFRMQTPGRAG